MPFEPTSLVSDIADAILVWCGIEDPTPTEIAVAELAAGNAVDTIRRYRRLDDAPAWVSEYEYVLNDVVQPTEPNGHLYLCTTAGTSDTSEPTWDTDTGSTTADGSTLVWTEYVREFESAYKSLAVEMGVYLWQKRGVDGVTAFTENGIQRSFEFGSFPRSMLARIRLPMTVG